MMQSIKHELWLIDEEKKDDEEHDEDEVFQQVKYNLVGRSPIDVWQSCSDGTATRICAARRIGSKCSFWKSTI